MDSQSLRIFEAVVRHGAMNRAAVAMNTVQSNVTARIRALERELAGCAYRERLETLLADRGIRDVAGLEFGTLDAIIGCLEGGLGITLLPRSLLQSAAEAGRIYLSAVPSEIGKVETLFIRRKDASDFSAMRALIAELSWTASAALLPTA